MTGRHPDGGAVTRRLAVAGCVAAEEEAAELLVAAPDEVTLESWVQRRETGEPLAWITGTAEFCGHRVRVDHGVYVPRRQSEELARRAGCLLASNGNRAVDLCTGSGAVAVHLTARAPSAMVLGVDADPRAIACARRNGVHAFVGDVDAPFCSEIFDVVTAVAPYVPTAELGFLPADVQRYESRLFLDGGSDGLDLVRRVVGAAGRLLRRGGWLLVELGGDQDRALSSCLLASGFGPSERWFDEDGDLRGLGARRT
ncbi:MAG: N5-glutamine methyltransferase family protein [Acidimicrobiales bacterium]